MCIALGAGSREWSITLPDCEEVIGLIATDKLVAVATDLRYLRIFSIMGTQREVINIPGPVVAISGYDNVILVAYYSGIAADEQFISVMLIQTIGLTLQCRDVKLPLTPGSKLNWIGYTDKGSPACADSLGIVRLFHSKSNYWMTICDTSLHVISLISLILTTLFFIV